MKVWLLLSRFEQGGLERVQLNLAKAMHARGIDVRLVAGQVIADINQDLPPALPVRQLARSGRAFFLPGIIRALFRDRPDVVFTTSNDVACLTVLLRTLFFKRMRVVVTQHLSLKGPIVKAGGIKRIKLLITLSAMRRLFPKADHVIAVSQGVASELLKEVGIRRSRLQVIYNPIVTPDFKARIQETLVWPWPDRDVKTIIFVGRLSAEKRLDLLLKSFGALIQRRSVRLLIVGNGPLKADLERCIVENNLEDHCRLTGFVPNTLPFIRGATVLVLPSDYEGFGNVLVEAMACGTQVIATDCPQGPAEILANGRFGQMVPVNDPKALEGAIQNTLDGRFQVPANELKARASEFELDAIVDRYVGVLTAGASTIAEMRLDSSKSAPKHRDR